MNVDHVCNQLAKLMMEKRRLDEFENRSEAEEYLEEIINALVSNDEVGLEVLTALPDQRKQWVQVLVEDLEDAPNIDEPFVAMAFFVMRRRIADQILVEADWRLFLE